MHEKAKVGPEEDWDAPVWRSEMKEDMVWNCVPFSTLPAVYIS